MQRIVDRRSVFFVVYCYAVGWLFTHGCSTGYAQSSHVHNVNPNPVDDNIRANQYCKDQPTLAAQTLLNFTVNFSAHAAQDTLYVTQSFDLAAVVGKHRKFYATKFSPIIASSRVHHIQCLCKYYLLPAFIGSNTSNTTHHFFFNYTLFLEKSVLVHCA